MKTNKNKIEKYPPSDMLILKFHSIEFLLFHFSPLLSLYGFLAGLASLSSIRTSKLRVGLALLPPLWSHIQHLWGL